LKNLDKRSVKPFSAGIKKVARFDTLTNPCTIPFYLLVTLFFTSSILDSFKMRPYKKIKVMHV
ncbi:hypothetical protein M8C21_006557, partial [Ambrosia artemisiifolia]